MAKVYEFLATGFEELEALAPVDILRRGGMDVTTVSVIGSLFVESSHGVTIKADRLLEDVDLDDADLLLLPGGMPGSKNLNAHEGVRQALLDHAAKGRLIGAICAAPMVLGSLGLLQGKRATCSPGFEIYLSRVDALRLHAAWPIRRQGGGDHLAAQDAVPAFDGVMGLPPSPSQGGGETTLFNPPFNIQNSKLNIQNSEIAIGEHSTFKTHNS